MTDDRENNHLNEGQVSHKSNMWSVLSPLIFIIIVIVLMIVFAK